MLTDLYRVLWGIIECFEDLSHLPSGPEVHPEAGHGTACGQADHTEETTHTYTRHQQTVKIISPYLCHYIIEGDYMSEICQTKTNVTSLRWTTAAVDALHSPGAAADSHLRQRVLRGCPHFKPVARYSKSSVNSWFSPNSTTSLKCFTCWTTVYSWKTQQQW